MKRSFEVRIGRLKLKNPVMVASGTFGEEYKELTNINSLGAIVMKTITLNARAGNPPPRIAETASGMLNSIGLENKGLEYFLTSKASFLKKLKIPVVASIAGNDEKEYALLAEGLDRSGIIDAIEINLSCPNIKHGNRLGLISQDERSTAGIVRAVRKATGLTVIAKLTPNVTDVSLIAKAAEDAGADAVLLINTFAGMAVDINTRKPKLGNITGGLSGPAIKPIALKAVWDTYKKIKIPVIGAGGIMDYKDAIEFILCGAAAIQVGTANFVDPQTTGAVVKGIKEYMTKNKISDINSIIGGLSA
ncbi:MAG: dihydroorotate dehydrogenase [Candidatus Omnitrophota bacterium]|jgi:dihydroorotate dehydrogenase (NAD+) catalytic subunit